MLFIWFLSRGQHLTPTSAATRPESHISESESYLSLAQSQSFFGIITGSDPRTHQSRLGALTPRSKYTPYMIAETRALDSFQNLSLSLEAFRNLYGAKPEKVTVVSHEFKRARFEELHFKVLQEKYASTVFNFEGQDPPYMVEGSPEYDATKAQKVRHAEKAKGYDMWAKDPQGSGEEVTRKRKERDFWGVQSHVGEDRERPENLSEIINENGALWSEQLR